jgi:chromosomal replication initiation ATPase DnaA
MRNKVINPYIVPGLKDTEIKAKFTDEFGNQYFNHLIGMIEMHSDIKKHQIVGSTRKGTVVLMRHLICKLVYENTGMSYKKIGQVLGNRDHTTIIHSVRTAEDLIKTNEEYATFYKFIKSIV